MAGERRQDEQNAFCTGDGFFRVHWTLKAKWRRDSECQKIPTFQKCDSRPLGITWEGFPENPRIFEQIRPVPLGGPKQGTDRDDNLLGGVGADTISGGPGDDVIWGMRWADRDSSAPDRLDDIRDLLKHASLAA